MLGKTLLILGLLLALLGAILGWSESQGWSYKNPLDFAWKKGNTQIYFPLGTSLLASLVLSLLFYLFKK